MLKLITNQNAYEEFRKQEVEILARTIYGEAYPYSIACYKAIANVILNRYIYSNCTGGYWWGNNIIQICQKPYQFNCWNRTDPSYRKIIQLTTDDELYYMCIQIALDTLANKLVDNINGATHYLNRHKQMPFWVNTEHPVQAIDDLLFYRMI